MPFLSHELVTQRSQTLESGGKLRPVLFESSAAQRISAPQVNIGAGQVKFSPVDEPRIALDTSIQSLADMSKTWVNSALKYQDTVDSITAEEQLLKTEMAVKEVTNKYLQTTSGKAKDEFDSFKQNIASTIESTISGIPDDAVRAKVIPGLVKLKQQATIAGSDHKVKQTAVWQDEVVKAKEIAARQNLVNTSDDPQKFMAVVGQHLQVIGAQENKGKEAILAEQNAFYSNILSDAITTHIQRGAAAEDLGTSGSAAFELASKYIEIGASEQFKADGVMLAKQSAALGNAIAQANSQKRTREREEAARVKEQREQWAKDIGLKALATGNASMINSIPDLELRAKVTGWFNTAQEGPETSPGAKMALLNQLDSIGSTSELIDVGLALGVKPKVILEMHGKTESLRKEGREEVLADIKRFANSMVPGGDPITGKFEKAENEQQYNAIYMRLIDKVRDAQRNNVSSTIALQDAKAEIFKDPNFQTNFAQVKLTRPMLSSAKIDGVPNDGMFNLDTIQDLKGVVDLPNGQQVSRIDYSFQAASANILKKYNLAGLSREQFIETLARNPKLHLEFKTDAANLEMQRRYFLMKSTELEEAKQKAKDLKGKTSGSKDKNAGY